MTTPIREAIQKTLSAYRRFILSTEAGMAKDFRAKRHTKLNPIEAEEELLKHTERAVLEGRIEELEKVRTANKQGYYNIINRADPDNSMVTLNPPEYVEDRLSALKTQLEAKDE